MSFVTTLAGVFGTALGKSLGKLIAQPIIDDIKQHLALEFHASGVFAEAKKLYAELEQAETDEERAAILKKFNEFSPL